MSQSRLRREVAFGYRTSELKRAGLLPEYGPVQDQFTSKFKMKGFDPLRRCPGRVSLGVHVQGAALPHPDHIDPESVLDGVKKRFAHAPPPVVQEYFDEFLEFVKAEARSNYSVLPLEELFDFEEWLGGSSYPEWRKAELREARERFSEMNDSQREKALMKVSSFIKDENYPVYKYPRPINSRSDEFKTQVGPVFKKIEKIVFDDPSFIKKVPRDQWPQYLSECLTEGEYVYVSDYSSFEALFEQLMDVEFAVYDHILQNHPDKREMVHMVDRMNECEFKHLKATVWRKRMSGEMNTSLGNGLTTHQVAAFIVFRKSGKRVKILQEGDDTVFVSPCELDESDFVDLGLEVKLERVTSVSEAQFCQLLFDPEEMVVVREPISYLTAFSWVSADYISTQRHDKKLLACKALSCASQYPGHPILQSFAEYILRVTHVGKGGQTREALLQFVERNRSFDSYIRERLVSAISADWSKFHRDVGLNTRLVVEKLFGIPIVDQIHLESWFDNNQAIQAIPLELIDSWVSVDWLTYYEWYVRDVSPDDHLWRISDVGPTCIS